ncbi:MAG TPA: protein-disulfide reductase DsbD domain-containing protein [Bryobacteraceae bacterium]|nr:protein-disulfide reductase DsbD domain-containing protein [Bryobacteraceae bacterium]
MACISLPFVQAQSSGHLQAGAPQKVVGKRGDKVQSTIPVTVDAGFHVNSDKPKEEFLIPLSLTWTATGALQAGAVVYPKATTETVGTDKLSVFTGKFNVIANFTVAPNATAGPGSVAGKLKYQACNNNTCFPPKTIEIAVPYQVQ